MTYRVISFQSYLISNWIQLGTS